MITTDDNHLFRGCSRDFENDVLFAKTMIETGDEHNIMMSLSYIVARARADLLISLNMEEPAQKDYVEKSVVAQNDLAIEYRQIVESSRH